MGAYCKLWRFVARHAGYKSIDAAPDQEGHKTVHTHMGVCNGVVGEVPHFIQRTKGFQCSLVGDNSIENDPNQNKWKGIAAEDRAPFPFHREQEVAGSGGDRNKHAHAKYNSYGLNPPWNGAEYKVMSTNHDIEHHLSPEGENFQ